jgi:hypothetical protein
VEPLRAEHSSPSSESRRGLAEIVAVVLGLTSIILYAALKLAPWLIGPGDLPLDEAVGDFVPYLLFGPALMLTCLGTVSCLSWRCCSAGDACGRPLGCWLCRPCCSQRRALSRRLEQGRLLSCGRSRSNHSPILCRRPSRQCRPSRAGELLERNPRVSRWDEGVTKRMRVRKSGSTKAGPPSDAPGLTSRSTPCRRPEVKTDGGGRLRVLWSSDGGHEILPGGGHVAARWRTWKLPADGHGICLTRRRCLAASRG